MENKLYKLSAVVTPNTLPRTLSYSHSIDKLEHSVISGTWTVVGKRDSTLVRQTINEVGIQYLIHEVNFII